MMQHRGVNGVAIGGLGCRSFEERERAMRLELLESVGRITHDNSPWFALRVMTGREIAVKLSLEELGITSLVPMRKGKTWERRGRKIEGVMQPVIFGYVLVQSDPSPDVLVSFKGVSDVLGVLGGAEKPMRVTSQEISRFKAMAEAGAFDWKRVEISFSAGEKVRISAGPFAGFIAEVVTGETRGGEAGSKAADLIVVTVEVFGRPTALTLPLVMLEKL